jgi:hypothetical protein
METICLDITDAATYSDRPVNGTFVEWYYSFVVVFRAPGMVIRTEFRSA